MDEQRRVSISKFLAKYLRHAPDALGLTLQPGGWVGVDSLLEACRQRNFIFSRAELDEVVARNSKQRFAFDETGTRIRANQGHSVEVDLQLEAITPPAILYHGTGAAAVESIRQNGISKMSRQHVHLSADVETAIRVGRRHGSPVVFEIDTAAMHRDGLIFYRSANGVWLTDYVPVRYLMGTVEE